MRKTIFTFAALLILCIAFSSKPAEGQWIQISTPEDSSIISLAVSGPDIFAGVYGGGICRSTNYGQNWTYASLNDNYVMSMAKRGDTLLAGTLNAFYYYGLYITTNNGEIWLPAGFYNLGVFAVAIGDNYAYAGTDSGVYVTSNGLNWELTLPYNMILAIHLNGSKVFAGTYLDGIHLSTNFGNNWTAIYSLPGLAILSIATSGNNVYSGTDSGVYLGNTPIGLNNRSVSSLAISETGIIAGTDSGVYLSTNNGQTWVQKNEGFSSKPSISELIIDNGYLYAGTVGQWIWKRPLSEIIGIKNISTVSPGGYKLGQNYPNPFNPNTIISFQLPTNNFVTLKIYDITGKEVERLVNEQLSAGSYKVDWNASAFSSGVYFYKLSAGNYTESKKMTLIK